MRLVVKVPAHAEHGPEPGLAEFTVTDMFLERLNGLASAVRNHRLHSLTTFDAVDVWSSKSFAAAHRLTRDERNARLTCMIGVDAEEKGKQRQLLRLVDWFARVDLP